MGGFLYIVREDGESQEELTSRASSGMEVMFRRGLTRGETIINDRFALFVFNKAEVESENALVFEDGDFVVATGTLFYRGRMGSKALRAIYDDYDENAQWFDHLRGHFGVCIFKKGKFAVFNDLGGMYHVYRAVDDSVIATSFLAVVRLLPRLTVSDQEVYEYVWYGAMYGDRTFYQEIERLDSYVIRQLWPDHAEYEKQITLPDMDPQAPFDEQVRVVSVQLLDYFGMLRDNFGDSICTALSGGFDSRLMVAALRKVGVTPHVYVYGDETSTDVAVARRVCRGIGLALHHTDKKRRAKPDLDEFPRQVYARYYFNDGQGVEGVLDNGADLATRMERARAARLQLNGGGGEIYRNFFKLPDRSISVRNFARIRYDLFDTRLATARFRADEHRERFAEKVKQALRTASDRLSRPEVERIYPTLRLRYWMGQNNGSNNVLGFAVTPFGEPCFAWPSAHIPLKWKNLGRFEAALIRTIDPQIASYPSQYGYDFTGPIPLRARCTFAAILHLPPALIPAVRRWKRRRSVAGSLPFYLTEPYVKGILDGSNMRIRDFLHLERICDPAVLNRALSLELTLSGIFLDAPRQKS